MSTGYDPPAEQSGSALPGPRHSIDDELARPGASPSVDTDSLYRRPGGPPPSAGFGSPVGSPPGAEPASAPPGYQPAAYPAPPYPLSAPPMSAVPMAVADPMVFGTARPPRRMAWPGIVALTLVVALAGFASFQAYQIRDLQNRVVESDQKLAEEQAADATRFNGIEERTGELETEAGKAFNPEAISDQVLPSVFRVAAGQFTGTAFAVGKPANGGATNLFTNYHVVESVWEAGDREVFIERRDQRWPATIVKVDEGNDVAQLRTTSKFTGLTTADAAAKSGQQVVVVGAPLGLEDTVTTGVISAIRKNEDGAGTVIQFDAPINPGNSGGPVINAAKQVVGIATAKARDAEGIGLAVPIKTACDVFKIC